VRSRRFDGCHSPPAATEQQEQGRSHFLALDGLRGFAALLVLFCHCVEVPAFLGRMNPPLGWHRGSVQEMLFYSPVHLFWDGEDAVVFFFVLSGFVLSLSFLEGRGLSYGRFLARRFFRLYPVLITAIFLSAAVVLVFAPARLPDLSSWLTGQSGYAISLSQIAGHILLLGSPYFQSLDMPIWSLVHEVRISVIFPLMMMILCRTSAGFGAMAVGIFLGAVAASHAMDLSPIAYDLMRSFHYLIFFALGAVLAKHRETWVSWLVRLKTSQRVLLLAAGLLAAGARWMIPFGATTADLSAGLGSAVVIALALSWPAFARQLVTPVGEWLGRISYSLYLIHMPVIAFCIYLLQVWISLVGCILAAIPVALGAAHLLARLVEVPAINLGRSLTRRAGT
jgi:peptidoglycan/LPS O-acetylase OafA/YrhL